MEGAPRIGLVLSLRNSSTGESIGVTTHRVRLASDGNDMRIGEMRRNLAFDEVGLQ